MPCDYPSNQRGPKPANLTALFQTLESDHYVCVRQKLDEDDKPQVIIIDLKNNNEVLRRPINADSAIMHWSKNIIALKAQGRTVQIFDLGAKQKLKSAVMNEDIVYWKWFSETSLGLVTDSAVYHWDVYDATQQNPVKMFDRLPNLAVCDNSRSNGLTWKYANPWTCYRDVKLSTTVSTPRKSGWSWLVSASSRAE